MYFKNKRKLSRGNMGEGDDSVEENQSGAGDQLRGHVSNPGKKMVAIWTGVVALEMERERQKSLFI